LLHEYRLVIADFDRVLRACPDELWEASLWEVKPTDPFMSPSGGNGPVRPHEAMQVFSAFWYVAYHCIFHLDFYLSQLDLENYAAPAPFGGSYEHGVDENRVATLPYRMYTRVS
jgi:hypothetical protein